VNRFRRRTFVLLTAFSILTGAARAYAQAAHSFPEIRTTAPVRTSHRWAYVSMAAGAGLIVASFPLAKHADDLYGDYAIATDPDQIESLYDETIRYDWYARSALISGEVLMGFGLYLRFIRQPRHDQPEATLDLRLTPGRCALAWSF
jgi:hypothetical protein